MKHTRLQQSMIFIYLFIYVFVYLFVYLLFISLVSFDLLYRTCQILTNYLKNKSILIFKKKCANNT